MENIDPVVLLFVGFIAIVVIGYLVLKRVGRVDYDSFKKKAATKEASANKEIPD